MSPERKRLTVALDIEVYQEVNKVAEHFGLDFSSALNVILLALFAPKAKPFPPAPVKRQKPE